MKAVIIYYSRSGVTEKLAKRIQADLQCDIIKIEPDDPYGNYVQSVIRVMKERKSKVNVKFITPIPDLTFYDIVLIGYPVWAQDLPTFVADFISDCNLAEKTVIPFVTFGASGVNWTMKTLKKVCPESKIVLPYEYGLMKKDNYETWLKAIKQTNKT